MFNPSQLLFQAWSVVLVVQLSCFSSRAQQLFPATVEVDLVFPRNDTYAATVLMPVIFAIQNTGIAETLMVGLEWQVVPIDDYNIGFSSTVKLENANISRSDPYFAVDNTVNWTNTENTWLLQWEAISLNCSAPNTVSEDGDSISGRNRVSSVFFTTKNGAAQADLVAATSDSTCATNSNNFTYNITDLLKGPWILDGQIVSSCVVLASTLPTPTANPCGARIDASAAASISAAITSRQCTEQLHPVISCPPTKNEGARAGQGAGAGGHFAWSTAIAGWLAYILAQLFELS